MAGPEATTAFATDAGQVREENQDCVVVRRLAHGGTLLVAADGMGGHLGGRTASHLAVDTIVHEIEDGDIEWNDPHQIVSLIERALLRANTDVHRAAQADLDSFNMGTTAVVVVVQGELAFYAHVGDSRLYLVRRGRAIRLTADHTRVHELVRNGTVRPEEAASHPDAHRLTRAIGISQEVEPEVVRQPLALLQHDVLLLCTDGLHEVVAGREIALAFGRFQPQEACERLIGLANSRGGPDNVTLAALRRDAPNNLRTRASLYCRREVAGLPLYLWWLLGGALVTASVLLGLSL